MNDKIIAKCGKMALDHIGQNESSDVHKRLLDVIRVEI